MARPKKNDQESVAEVGDVKRDPIDFGGALEALRASIPVARLAWSAIDDVFDGPTLFLMPETVMAPAQIMKLWPDSKMAPWQAVSADMLAEDWIVVTKDPLVF